MLFDHQVKAQLEFAASEEASAGPGASGASSGSPSTSNEAYAAPLPLASYTG